MSAAFFRKSMLVLGALQSVAVLAAVLLKIALSYFKHICSG